MREALSGFPYLRNYEQLVAHEAQCLRSAARVVVGGAGPAPLTGLLLHAKLGVPITLVDSDADAVGISTALVQRLVEHNVVAEGAIEVCQADVADAPTLSDNDAILVACLVDEAAKLRLARRIAGRGSSGPRVLLRSARGLCARLAYTAVPQSLVEEAGLALVGRIVPRTQIIQGLPPDEAAQFGVLTDLDPKVLAVAPPTVLNVTEVYRPHA